MLTLAKRLTRPDHATIAGGIIVRSREEEPRFVVHYFERERGSPDPKPGSFFHGSYCDTEEKAFAEFSRRVENARRYDRGGSLIPEDREIGDLMVEKVRV